jgi:hypothetical protein
MAAWRLHPLSERNLMRVFRCDNCGQLVFFDNSQCLRCDAPLGYVHSEREIISLIRTVDERLVDRAAPVRTWRRCATAERTGCNWLVPAAGVALCESCQLTRTRPADTDAVGLRELGRSEMAKRRLIFQLAELGLPVVPRREDTGTGLAFDLLSSTRKKVITGHDDGIITLDLAEADDEHRERLRLQLSEPYRTVLGHFRHEIGHYYWPLLVQEPDDLQTSRALFGDDRVDYADAVKSHYETLDDDDGSWQQDYISRYAAMHPYEDWAETFAHYLHILDTLQTAESFGLGAPGAAGSKRLARRTGAHPTRPDGSTTFGEVVDNWLELSYALNQINRSMGSEDLYPFVLAAPVIRKMAFVDQLVTRSSAAR